MAMAREWRGASGIVALLQAAAPPLGEDIASNAVAGPGDDAQEQVALALYESGRELAGAGYYSAGLLRFSRARALGAADPALLLNSVWTLLKAGRFERCISLARDTLKLYPEHAEVENTMGLALREVGEFDEAERLYEGLLGRLPRFRSAHINLALLKFRRQDYLRGAEHFEWRFGPDDGKVFDVPGCWDEQRLHGKRVLLQHEQGLGDTINFLRLAEQVSALGASVTALVQRPLLQILRPAFPGITLATDARASSFDFHAPLLCVLHRLRLTPQTIPAQSHPLKPDADRVAHWRMQLRQHRGLRVGLVYTGQARQGRNRYRALPPEGLAELAHIPGLTLFDLQMRKPDRPGLRSWERAGIVNLGTSLDHGLPAFSDTMAVMQNLDLVITCDTSTAHLAGAMNCPVWIGLDYASDWRWHEGGERSNWYRSARLYRQKSRGDWNAVFKRMRGDLLELVERKRAHHATSAVDMLG